MSGGCCGRQSLRVRRRLLSCSPHRRQIHRYEHGRCCTGVAGGDSFLWRSRVAPRRRETDAKEAPASTPCAKRQRRCRSLVKTAAPAQATPCLKPPPPGDSPALAIDAGVPTHPWKATVKARPGRAGLRCLCRGRSGSRSAPLCTAFIGPLKAWFPPQILIQQHAAQVEDGGKECDVGQGRGVLPDDALELCAECLVKRKFHSPHREQSVVSLSSVLIVLDLSSCCDWHDSWRRASRKRAPRKRHRPRRLRPGAAGVSRLRPANPEGHSRQERPNSKESSKALVSAAAHGPWPSPPHPNTSQVSPCPSTPTSPEKAALRCARMKVPRSCPCW